MLLSRKIGQDPEKFPLTKSSLIMEVAGTGSHIHLKCQEKDFIFLSLLS